MHYRWSKGMCRQTPEGIWSLESGNTPPLVLTFIERNVRLVTMCRPRGKGEGMGRKELINYGQENMRAPRGVGGETEIITIKVALCSVTIVNYCYKYKSPPPNIKPLPSITAPENRLAL